MSRLRIPTRQRSGSGSATAMDPDEILLECEAAMEKAYQHTLNGKSLTTDVREVLTSQQAELHKAHDEIKGLGERTD